MSVMTDNRKIFKGLIIGVGVSAAVCAVLMCIASLALNMIKGIPYGILDYITVGIAGISVLIGSYIASAIAKSRGLIVGLAAGAILFLFTLAAGLSREGNDISVLTAIRAAVLLLLGALGGIKGVNRKEKIRIH